MLNLAITGGMGSGKSMVCRIFDVLGIPTYNSDLRNKWILINHHETQERIRQELGESVFRNDILDRDLLAQLIFSNDQARETLNAIMHPAVKQDFLQWKEKQNAPATLSEAAIYFETGRYKEFDKIILVVADKELRVQRVLKRSDMNREHILARMDTQWSDEKKMELADFIIYNDGNHSVIEQVNAILANLGIKPESISQNGLKGA